MRVIQLGEHGKIILQGNETRGAGEVISDLRLMDGNADLLLQAAVDGMESLLLSLYSDWLLDEVSDAALGSSIQTCLDTLARVFSE
jgi:hypothetical protein